MTATRGRAPAAELKLKAAPKRLAWLAEEMRGWGYEDTLGALKACSDAGWDDIRIYREVFRLLLIADSSPDDLRAMARRPARAAGMSEETRQLLAAAKQDCDTATPLVRKNDPPAA